MNIIEDEIKTMLEDRKLVKTNNTDLTITNKDKRYKKMFSLSLKELNEKLKPYGCKAVEDELNKFEKNGTINYDIEVI